MARIQKTFTLDVSDEEYNAIRDRLKKDGSSISRYVSDKLREVAPKKKK